MANKVAMDELRSSSQSAQQELAERRMSWHAGSKGKNSKIRSLQEEMEMERSNSGDLHHQLQETQNVLETEPLSSERLNVPLEKAALVDEARCRGLSASNVRL